MNGELNGVEILCEKDVRFSNFRSDLDARMKQLVAEAVGTVKKHADPLTKEMNPTMGYRSDWNALWRGAELGYAFN
mgnify:CR=1 FL=1